MRRRNDQRERAPSSIYKRSYNREPYRYPTSLRGVRVHIVASRGARRDARVHLQRAADRSIVE